MSVRAGDAVDERYALAGRRDRVTAGRGRHAALREALEASLRARLQAARASGLWREAAPCPAGLIDLSTNDYLALRRDPRLAEACGEAARIDGVGAGASRLAGGTSNAHERLERRFASFKGAEAALVLPTGYAANLSLLTALPAPGDLLLCDRLNHASLWDAARLAKALRPDVRWRSHRHLDLDHAESLARRRLEHREEGIVWLVSDSVFSMDGDVADVPALAALRDRLRTDFDGRAGLILDEAHATGALGPGGAGLDAAAGHPADATVSTASKALGSLGGIICGSRTIIETVVNFARPFIYSTAAPPPQLASIDAALDVLASEPERMERLSDLSSQARDGLREKGWPVAPHESHPTPIIPLMVGEPGGAIALQERLAAAGFHAPAIRPPTVPRGRARVRLSIRWGLTEEQVARLVDAAPAYDGPRSGAEASDGDAES